MNYNSSSTNYYDHDPHKIYFSSYDWAKYYQMTEQEAVTFYRPSWDHEYKSIWGDQFNNPMYEVIFDNYETIRNDRLNKIDKKKAELLSWIDNKENV